MDEKWLLIDSNYICHYIKYKMSYLTHRGIQTGIIFGFFREILSLSKRFDTTKFIFIWDSVKSIRKIKNTMYKANRKKEKTKEELVEDAQVYNQFSLLRTKILLKFGFRNIFLQTGYEADDIIASICKDYEDQEIVIVASDNDLYQLITDNHYIFNPKIKKEYTIKDFRNEWGIEPKQWADVKCIAGCTTDNVDGISGVKNKTAVKYLKGKLKDTTIAKAAIESKLGQEIIEDNYFFVVLPMDGTYHYMIDDKEIFYVQNFVDICEKYGFESFLTTIEQWKARFNMGVRR